MAYFDIYFMLKPLWLCYNDNPSSYLPRQSSGPFYAHTYVSSGIGMRLLFFLAKFSKALFSLKSVSSTT